jgi:alpha-N-arabinofuranosidase
MQSPNAFNRLNPLQRSVLLLLIFIAASAGKLPAEMTNPIPRLIIKADQMTGHVSPTLYGLMTEEINYAYEGGLYAN